MGWYISKMCHVFSVMSMAELELGYGWASREILHHGLKITGKVHKGVWFFPLLFPLLSL